MKRLILLLSLMVALCTGCTRGYSRLESMQVYLNEHTYSAETKEGDSYNILEISPKLELVERDDKSHRYQYIDESDPDGSGFNITFLNFVSKYKPVSYREDMEETFSKLKKSDNKRLIGTNGLGANLSSYTHIARDDFNQELVIFTFIRAYKEVNDGVLEVLLLADDDIRSQELYDQIQTMDHPFVKAFNQRVMDSVTFFPEK